MKKLLGIIIVCITMSYNVLQAGNVAETKDLYIDNERKFSFKLSDLGYVNVTVSGNDTKRQFRTASLDMEIGIEPTPRIQLYYGYNTKHTLDHMLGSKFSRDNVIGFRFFFIRGEK